MSVTSLDLEKMGILNIRRRHASTVHECPHVWMIWNIWIFGFPWIIEEAPVMSVVLNKKNIYLFFYLTVILYIGGLQDEQHLAKVYINQTNLNEKKKNPN